MHETLSICTCAEETFGFLETLDQPSVESSPSVWLYRPLPFMKFDYQLVLNPAENRALGSNWGILCTDSSQSAVSRRIKNTTCDSTTHNLLHV